MCKMNIAFSEKPKNSKLAACYKESYIAMLITYSKRSKKHGSTMLAREKLEEIGINPNDYYRKYKNWYNIYTNKPIITH